VDGGLKWRSGDLLWCCLLREGELLREDRLSLREEGDVRGDRGRAGRGVCGETGERFKFLVSLCPKTYCFIVSLTTIS